MSDRSPHPEGQRRLAEVKLDGLSSSSSPGLCPSAQPNTNEALAIGVIDHCGETPEVTYLERPLRVSGDLLSMSGPLRPTEIFRFAASCQTSACAHWTGSKCKLVERVVKLLPEVSLALPKCHIRNQCRWFFQEGRSACARCPQVVTQNENPSSAMRKAAKPK